MSRNLPKPFGVSDDEARYAPRPWRPQDRLTATRLGDDQAAARRLRPGVPPVRQLFAAPVGGRVIEVRITNAVTTAGQAQDADQADYFTEHGAFLVCRPLKQNGSYDTDFESGYFAHPPHVIPVTMFRTPPTTAGVNIFAGASTEPTFYISRAQKGWHLLAFQGLKLVNPPAAQDLCP